MKRNFLFYSIFIVASFVVNLSTVVAQGGQGISYYKAGFPLVAKPLLISELESNIQTQAEVCFYLGNIYFNENQADSAALYFNKGLTANPLYPLNTIGLAMLKIKSNPVQSDLDIVNCLKDKVNKKNVDLVIAAANAYLNNGLIDKAVTYQEKAKSIKPKYALVSVLLGDIELAKGNTGTACGNYEQAIYFDESCKEAYIKYARAYKNVNPNLAIEMLGKLKIKEPSFLLVDRELADIYYAIDDFPKAAERYESYMQSGNFSIDDLTQYAFILFYSHNYAKSLEVINKGIAKSPRNAAFNRLSMYNNTDLKQFNEALKSANLLFNQSDKTKFLYLDYFYYGQALRETKQFDLAIPQFQKALTIDSSKVELLKDISDMYNEKADMNNAILYYNKYLSALTPEARTSDVIMPLGKLYYGYATKDSIAPELKKASLLKADSLFAVVASLEPTGYRGNFWRANTNTALDDADASQGLAKPYYEQTIALIEAKTDAARYNSILVTCYSYLGVYFLKKDKVEESTICWNKILVIQPENALAKRILDDLAKEKKQKKK
jgi:tetratricopeptide (TPR) repeat protein